MANIARTGQSKRIDTRRFSIYAPDRFELFWILLGKARGLYAETATCQRHASNYWSLFLPRQFRWNELGGHLNAERTPNTSPTPQPAPFPVFGIKAGRPRFRNRSFFKQAGAQEGFKTIISSSRILALSYPLSSANSDEGNRLKTGLFRPVFIGFSTTYYSCRGLGRERKKSGPKPAFIQSYMYVSTLSGKRDPGIC